ncbi:MAG TPA: NAD(P)H-dependent oxidoreductase, partial [Vicinamibacterales bacterium]|nr:NAD(P)H-dependent oxidoreductase [Vicinamibacterales bacterium]
ASTISPPTSDMSKLKIKVIVASTRANRFSEKPASVIFEAAQKREELDVELIDLRDYPLPFFEEPAPPGLQGKDNYPKPAIMKWRAKVVDGDGFIICTPEYNHGYPAVLKNALDYVYYDWSRKPVAFVSWGGGGGTRGVEQLRLVTIELDMVPLRWAVHIPNPWFIKDASELKTEANLQATSAMLDHLTWWTRSLKNARQG